MEENRLKEAEGYKNKCLKIQKCKLFTWEAGR